MSQEKLHIITVATEEKYYLPYLKILYCYIRKTIIKKDFII